MTDLQLLRQQVILNPTDTALLAAFEDELLANGEDTQAFKVRIVRQNLHNDRPLMGETEDDRRCRLLFWMGLRHIQINDCLGWDKDGKVYPTACGQCSIGTATSTEADGRVQVRLLNPVRGTTDHEGNVLIGHYYKIYINTSKPNNPIPN